MNTGLAQRVIAAIAALDRVRPIVLIDGPSGVGKSTLADMLIERWPARSVSGLAIVPAPQLVRLDDLYPGWGGLSAGSKHLVDEVLEPLHATGTGRWQAWDWAASRPADWREVTATRPLVVEGCGALSRASAPLAELAVWLVGDDEVRKRRALARDGGTFDAHWQMWDEQFAEFVARERPLSLADVVLDTAVDPYRGSASTRYIRGMSSTEAPTEYVTEFLDGPLEGQTQHRSYIDGDYERELDMYVAVEGLPAEQRYVSTSTRQVGDTLFVSYRWDSKDSDSIEVDDQDTNI